MTTEKRVTMIKRMFVERLFTCVESVAPNDDMTILAAGTPSNRIKEIFYQKNLRKIT